MKRARNILLVIFVGLTLTACGGGSKSNRTTTNPSFETPRAVSTYQPLVGATTEDVIIDIFTKDLNGDNNEEVVVVGRQSNDGTAYVPKAFNVRIFGWTSGSLADETSTWFNAGENIIIGSEPSVQFGNFNNDGSPDMVIAAGTDNPGYKGKTMVFLSDPSNTQFIRTETGTRDIWSHGSVVHDLNADTIDDIIVVGYGQGGISVAINNGDGTFVVTEFAGGASGVSVGDYVPGGNLEVVLSDNNGTGNTAQDTWMYELDAIATPPTLTSLVRLPDSILVNSHAIRNIALDFSGDGVKDVVVFERQQLVANGEPVQSLVQFLQNDGFGVFTDVTNTTVSGYDNSNGGVNYQPVVADFGGVNGNDIFLSGQDFEAPFTQTQILVETSAGVFESKYATEFTAFWNTISSSSTGENIHIVTGPGAAPYIVGNVVNGANATLYVAKVKTIW